MMVGSGPCVLASSMYAVKIMKLESARLGLPHGGANYQVSRSGALRTVAIRQPHAEHLVLGEA